MSDTDYCGDLYKILEISEVLECCFVNNIGQKTICKNVNFSAHNAVDLMMRSYGVSYGDYVVFSFSDGAKRVPPLDFAAFLPISRYNAAKTDEEYRPIVSAQLDTFDCGGIVITMAIERTSHEIAFYSELSADDYFDCLYSWSTKCSAEFLLTDGSMPFCSVITPSLRQITAYAFGREKDGFFTADDYTLGEVCVELVDCILCRKPIDKDITDALESQMRKKECNVKNYCRLCSIYNTVKRYNASFGVYI